MLQVLRRCALFNSAVRHALLFDRGSLNWAREMGRVTRPTAVNSFDLETLAKGGNSVAILINQNRRLYHNAPPLSLELVVSNSELREQLQITDEPGRQVMKDLKTGHSITLSDDFEIIEHSEQSANTELQNLARIG